MAEEVKQVIEQLETVDGFETVNETKQPREAEGINCVTVHLEYSMCMIFIF